MIWKLLRSAQNSKIGAIFIDFTNRTFHDLNVGQNYVSQLENDFPGQNINPAFICGHIWPRKLSLANMWPNWLSTKLQNVAKGEEFSSKSKKRLVTSIGVWPRVKTISKVFPLAKNMFGPMSKSISGVRISLWPSFGHISCT